MSWETSGPGEVGGFGGVGIQCCFGNFEFLYHPVVSLEPTPKGCQGQILLLRQKQIPTGCQSAVPFPLITIEFEASACKRSGLAVGFCLFWLCFPPPGSEEVKFTHTIHLQLPQMCSLLFELICERVSFTKPLILKKAHKPDKIDPLVSVKTKAQVANGGLCRKQRYLQSLVRSFTKRILHQRRAESVKGT